MTQRQRPLKFIYDTALSTAVVTLLAGCGGTFATGNGALLTWTQRAKVEAQCLPAGFPDGATTWPVVSTERAILPGPGGEPAGVLTVVQYSKGKTAVVMGWAAVLNTDAVRLVLVDLHPEDQAAPSWIDAGLVTDKLQLREPAGTACQWRPLVREKKIDPEHGA